GQGDEALGVLGEPVEADAGLAPWRPPAGAGEDTATVGAAAPGPAEQGEVGFSLPTSGMSPQPLLRAPTPCPLLLVPCSSNHRDFRADDGLDAPGGGGLCELHGAGEAVVVRNGEGGVAEGLGPEHELLGAGSAFAEGEGGVTVQLDITSRLGTGWR